MENHSSCKKRKTCREDDEEEQEDEAKMEAFFALVRSIRESRDRWISLRSGHRENKRSKSVSLDNKEENRNRVVAVWKPTFQLEDFAEEVTTNDHKCKHPEPSVALLGGASRSNNCAKEEDAEKGIDLKLSL